MAKPRNVVNATETHGRVWNITDHPGTEHKAAVRMIAGVNVPPGRYVRVPLDRLAKSKKLMSDAAAKIVHIGNSLPPDYAKALPRGAKIILPKKHARSHGTEVSAAAVKASAKPKPRGGLKELPRMPAPAVMEEPVAGGSLADSLSEKSRKRSGKS